MGVKSRIRSAPLLTNPWRELSAAADAVSAIAIAIGLTSAEEWQELAANLAASSDVALSLSSAQWQELASSVAGVSDAAIDVQRQLAIGTPLLVWNEAQVNRRHDTSVNPTYQTSASAYALATADATRLEDTGDSNGALLLCEGQRACININSRAISAWSVLNSASVVANTENGPEGSLTADAVTYPNTVSGAMSQTETAANVPSSTNLAWQAWAKRGTGQDEKFRFWIQDKSAASGTPQTGPDNTVTATWQRFTWDVDSGAGAGNPVFRLRNASDGVARGAGRIVAFGGVCVEAAKFPSSLILNESAGQLGKRYEDLVLFSPAQVPLVLRTGKWSTGTRTKWASADLLSGDIFVLFSFGDADNVLRFRHTGTDVRLEAVVGGSVIASSGAVSVPRQGYLPIVVDSAAGVLTVNGVAGSAGSAIVWPGGVHLRIGGVVGAAYEAFAAIDVPKAA